jgi:NADH-quinone oxidoreductase subunit L
MSGTFRRIQTGYVRSYALSVMAGALVVVLALLAVNFA